MNVALLELLELDDLPGEARELAECIGMEAFRRLLEQMCIRDRQEPEQRERAA